MRLKSNAFNIGKKIFLLATATLVFAANASATYRERLSFTSGFAEINSPRQRSFAVGGEFEHRLRYRIGLGFGGNYVFANPKTSLLAAPELFFHPFRGDWFFNAAPVFQFQTGNATKVGLRLGTRVQLPLEVINLAPFFDYDFINGGHQYVVGVAVEYQAY